MERLTFTAKAALGRVDARAGKLTGCSVISIGPLLGHGMDADAETLATVKAAADKTDAPTKVKLDHGSGAGAIVGGLGNFRISGKQCIADMSLLSASPHRGQVLELAQSMPTAFGLSIDCNCSTTTIGGAKFLRVSSLNSVDIVSDPAANAGGLFSARLSAATRCGLCGAEGSLPGMPCKVCGSGSLSRAQFNLLSPQHQYDAIKARVNLTD